MGAYIGECDFHTQTNTRMHTWMHRRTHTRTAGGLTYYIKFRLFDGTIGEESVEVGRTCRTNERGSTTKDGICSPGERKTTHRERHEKTGVGGRGLDDGGPG